MNRFIPKSKKVDAALADLQKAVTVSCDRWQFAQDRFLTVLPKIDAAYQAGATFGMVVPILTKALKSKPRTRKQDYDNVASMLHQARQVAKTYIKVAA